MSRCFIINLAIDCWYWNVPGQVNSNIGLIYINPLFFPNLSQAQIQSNDHLAYLSPLLLFKELQGILSIHKPPPHPPMCFSSSQNNIKLYLTEIMNVWNKVSSNPDEDLNLHHSLPIPSKVNYIPQHYTMISKIREILFFRWQPSVP